MLERLSGNLLLDPPRLLPRDGSVSDRVLVAQGQSHELLPVRQSILEGTDIRTPKRDGLLAVAKVEQPVAQRKIEEFALPPLDAALRRVRLLVALFTGEAPEVRAGGQCCRRDLLLHYLFAGRYSLAVRLRTYSRSTRPRNVHRHHELGFAILCKTAPALILGVREPYGRTLGQQGCFERNQLMSLYGLAYGDYVRLGDVSQVPLLNPDADPRVALREENHRVESGGLERRRQEECRIEAGRQAFLRDPGRTADLLTPCLEGRRWLSVVKAERGCSRPDRGGQHVCPSRILGLVPIHGAIVSRSFQQAGGILEQLRDGRLVWRDECSQHLCHVRETAPLVSSQEIDAFALDDRLDPVGLDSKLEFSEFRLVHSRQTRYVQIGPGVRDLVLRSWCDAIQHRRSLSQYGGRRAQGHPDARKRLVGFVSQSKAPDDRDVVLGTRRVDLAQDLPIHGDHCVSFWRHGGFQSVFAFLAILTMPQWVDVNRPGDSRQTATGTTAGRYYPTELQTRKGTAQR